MIKIIVSSRWAETKSLASSTYLMMLIQKNCTLIDKSLGMLKVAESRLKSEENNFPKHIRLIQSDAFNLPFEKESFDILCSFGTIHLFDNKQNFVNTILQFLKPGGNFYFLAMTNKYVNSRLFMNFLCLFGEFGKVRSGGELLGLFPSNKFEGNSSMKGSVFIYKREKI